jgi:hypothetical protein
MDANTFQNLKPTIKQKYSRLKKKIKKKSKEQSCCCDKEEKK